MPHRELHKCCSSLLQALLLFFALLLWVLFFRPFAEGHVDERWIQVGQNLVAVMLGAQLAVVVFRWRVYSEQSRAN